MEKQVGPLAVKAKYRVLQYLDQKVEADERERLKQLSSDLEKLARKPAIATCRSMRLFPLRRSLFHWTECRKRSGRFRAPSTSSCARIQSNITST